MTLRNLVVMFGAAVALVGCSSEESETHSLTLEVRLTAEGDRMSFVSPAASVIEHALADVVGKPYYSATFEAGFSPGNDLPLFEEWGVVPDSLSIDIANPTIFEDGEPYDMVFVVYVTTDAIPGEAPVVAAGGDLATFTIDQTVVRDGDPTIIPGVVRLVVDGADGAMRVENRVPENPDDGGQLQEAMTNTVMIVP